MAKLVMNWKLLARHERDDQDVEVGIFQTIDDALDAARLEMTDTANEGYSYSFCLRPTARRT